MVDGGANMAKEARIMLGVLEAAQGDGRMSQRRLAADLGIALGLVNTYVKRCVRKGLLKVSQVPARRYAYYLTPEGFAEKSRLTVEYLSVSLSFFREARTACADELATAKASGWRRVALAGASDVAEIAALCAIEAEIEVVGIVDSVSDRVRIAGLPVFAGYEGFDPRVDAVIVTAITDLEQTLAAAMVAVGAERVLVPALLAARINRQGGSDV